MFNCGFPKISVPSLRILEILWEGDGWEDLSPARKEIPCGMFLPRLKWDPSKNPGPDFTREIVIT